MLEAICRLRARLGVCVIMYVPAHVGCSPNEYADACAKSHLGNDEMEDATGRLRRWVVSRPRITERHTEEEGWVAMDRSMYGGARVCAGGYVRRRLSGVS